MKLVWLTLLVVGVATLTRAAEEEMDHLQELDARTFNLSGLGTSSVTTVAMDPFSQFLLALGNIGGFINNANLTGVPGLGGAGLGAGLGAGGAALGAGLGAAGAGLGAVGTTLAALTTIKTAILDLLLKPLDLANFVLAIIALVFLIIYLVNTEGDIGGLIGSDITGFLRRESDDVYHDSYSNYVNTARSLWDSSVVQRLTTLVHDAITKYDY